MKETNLNDPSGIQAKASLVGKTIQQIRSEFRADLARNVSQGADCLTPGEMLDLQVGEEPSPGVLEHLNVCAFCSGLRQAMEVRPNRLEQFQREVRTVPENIELTKRSDWRLPASGLIAASVALLIWSFPQPEARGSIELASNGLPQVEIVEITVQGPEQNSVQTTARVLAKKGTISVRDYAPAIATAYILPKVAITLSPNTPKSRAEAQERMNQMIGHILAAQTPRIEQVGKVEGDGWRLKLSDTSTAWISNKDFGEAVKIKEMALGGNSEVLRLDNGGVIQLAKTGFLDEIVNLTSYKD